MPLCREELAWAGGLFTGEGTTGYSLNGTRVRRIRMQLQMTTEADVQRFHKAVGSLGTIIGPRDMTKWNPNAKPLYRWGVANFEGVQAIIAMLWPWLGNTKKAQAAKALTAYKAGQHRMVRVHNALI